MIYPVRVAILRKWDSQGNGAFGSRRGSKPHYGEDLIVEPGQDIISPIDGVLKRQVQAYEDSPEFKGAEIVSDNFIIKILYIEPDPDLVGKPVNMGQVIGKAQDVSIRYPGITKHIHFEVYVKPSFIIKEAI